MIGYIAIGGLLAWYLYSHLIGKRRGLPPGPVPFPIAGNILSVSPKAPHKTIFEWSKKYGSIYTLWIGNTPNLIISGYDDLKKLMSGREGEILAGRPFNWLINDLVGKHGIMFSTGSLWKEQRRFTLHVLRDFGFGKTIIEDGINEQIGYFVKYFKEIVGNQDEVVIEAKQLETQLMLRVTSVIAKVVLGHGFETQDPGYKVIFKNLTDQEKLGFSPFIILLQAAPWLRHVPGFTSLAYDQLKNNFLSFKAVMKDELEKHKAALDEEGEPKDFVDAYLLEMIRRRQANSEMEGYSDEQLMAIMLDLWSAGTQTASLTMRWAFFYMIHHPHIQAKIQAEMDELYGSSERPVTMADRMHLPLAAATLMEIQRVANIVPLNLPHCNLEEMDIAGYRIKKGTTVIPQIASLHVNPDLFPEPDEFNPERFLEDGGKTIRKDDHLLPFSLGKRVCAGESLARMELFMLFTSMLRNFQLLPDPDNKMPDLRNSMGIACVIPPAYQFKIRPRYSN